MRELHEDDGFAETRLLIANEALQGGKVDEAIRLLSEAVAMDFDYRPSALSLLADALDRQHAVTGDPALLGRLVDVDRALAALPDANRLVLANLGIDLRRWFERAGDVAALDESAGALRAALRAPPVADPSEAWCWFELLVVHRTRFEVTDEPESLDQAIEAGLAAVDAVTPGDAERCRYYSGLGGVLLSRARSAKDPDLLEQAIAKIREAAETTPRYDPDWPGRRANLAKALYNQYELSDRPDLLDEAIALLREAAAETEPGSADRAALVRILHTYWGTRSNRDAAAAGLSDASVATGRLIVELAGPGDPARAVYLSNLALALLARFQHDGDETALDAAVATARQSLETTPPSDADHGHHWSSARRVLSAAYTRRSDLGLLDEAIDAGRTAVAATPAGSLELGPRLITLGGLLNERFDASGTADDLDEAVDCADRAVRAPAPEPRDRLARQTILAMDLRKRYERTGDTGDLRRAVMIMGEVVAQPGTADELGQAQSALMAESLYILSDRLNDLTSRQYTVDAARRDLEHVDEQRRILALHRLGTALWRNFQLTGDVTVLDEAITYTRTLVAAVDENRRASVRANLGRQLRALYLQTGDLAVLREATATLRRVVREAAPDDPELPGYLSATATALAEYGERANQPGLAMTATGLHRDAVAISAGDDPHHPVRLAKLAEHLVGEFGRTGDQSLLSEAVDDLRRALESQPAQHPDRPLFLLELSSTLLTRFRANRDRADLDASIDAARQVLDLLPAGHYVWSAGHDNLGSALAARFELTGAEEDIDGAIEALQAAAAEPQGSPGVRLRAAIGGATVAARAGRAAEAMQGFALAVELLPALSPRHLNRDDQEHHLSGYSGLAALACAAALDAGDPNRAVLLLEQARGVLLAQSLETRSDVTDLQQRYPAVAAEFEAAREDLNTVPAVADEPADVAARARRERTQAWQKLLGRIRQLPSFERFLLPPALSDLLEETTDGPIIMLSAAPSRSDALALTSSGVRHVPLPRLTWAATEQRIRDFSGALATFERPGLSFPEYYAANLAVSDILGWLWEVAAGPVLDALGCDGTAPQRVWWAPAGKLAVLPWHAAGHHDRRDERPAPTVLDRVISSYTPTLRTLVHLRGRHRHHEPGADPLLVGLAETPGAAPLHGVTAEIDHLAALMPAAVVLRDERATRDRVLAGLRRATLAHFACHGVSVPGRPSSSRLLVHDHAERPLTVLDIARLHPERAQLAYLSACSTAQASARLTDEAIHITSAFQLAGFPHVIGTLWTVDDLAAADLTRRVYDGLARSPAPALHAAVRAARDRDPDRPELWAAHVHAGV